MEDRERISNLEELMAEAMMRLENSESGQKVLSLRQTKLETRMNTPEENMLEFAKNQISFKERQANFQENLMKLTRMVMKNSVDLEIIKSTMCTKEDLNNLFKAMVARFDAIDERFEKMERMLNVMR